MAKITWTESTTFLGRNGHFRCNGVELLHSNRGLQISPITSKGDIGRAHIEIPYNKLNEFAKVFGIFTMLLGNVISASPSPVGQGGERYE